MRGNLMKRGDSWQVRISLGRDENGKRLYHHKTFRLKKDGERYLSAALRENDLGIFTEPSNVSLNEYLNRWLETAAKPRLRERTYLGYADQLKRHVREPLGGKKLSALRPLDIQETYSQMQERGISPRTIRYTHAVLSSALKQATQWGLISRNPAQLVQLPKASKKNVMRSLTSEEAARFLQTLGSDRYATLFSFALATGMRPEEYLALQWSDVNLQTGTATVQRALIWKKGGGWYFDQPKTDRSRRIIPLPASVVRQLVEHKRHQNEERLKVGPEWQQNDLVFCTEIGSPIYAHNLIKRHFKPALKRAGLPQTIRLYDLRHTTATLLLLAGENPKVVSERLGHASITLTLDTYSHVLPDMQKAAAEKLEKLLFG